MAGGMKKGISKSDCFDACRIIRGVRGISNKRNPTEIYYSWENSETDEPKPEGILSNADCIIRIWITAVRKVSTLRKQSESSTNTTKPAVPTWREGRTHWPRANELGPVGGSWGVCR